MKILLPLLAIVFITAFLLGSLFTTVKTVYVNQTESKTVYISELQMQKDSETFISKIYAPAVDEENNGVITTVQVQARKGTGQVLTNIDKILFWVDTQSSIITARNVATNITGINSSSYDLTYTITAEASIIEGPSAGAALTVATIAALLGEEINPNVTITGTINPDGSIGSVGKVFEKAKAAKDFGAEIFLIPEGYDLKTYGYHREKECGTIDGIEHCEVKYVKKELEKGEEIGLTIKEIKYIGDALEYFLGE